MNKRYYKITNKGIFHPVGQGLFHSSNLTINENDNLQFNYIYDCGTSSNQTILENAITKYLTTINSRSNIDAVFISHLHKDHVSGIPFLFKKKRVSVKRVILPYLFPYERALIVALAEKSLPDEYIQLLSHPYKYFRGKGVKDVFFVVGDDNSESSMPDITPNPVNDNKLNTIEHIDQLLEVNRTKLQQKEVKNIKDAEQLVSGDTQINSKSLMRPSSSFRLTNWYFTFFNKRIKNKMMDQFKTKFIKICAGRSLNEMISSKSDMKKLKSVYISIFSNSILNDTSLAVFSGLSVNKMPKKERFFVSMKHPLQRSFTLWSLSPNIKRIGVLYTGDLNVKNEWITFEKYFHLSTSNQSSEICVYQVPHHGSKYNWNYEQAKIERKPLYVVSASINSIYPNKTVSQEILNHHKPLCLVNEKRSCHYEIRFHGNHIY